MNLSRILHHSPPTLQTLHLSHTLFLSPIRQQSLPTQRLSLSTLHLNSLTLSLKRVKAQVYENGDLLLLFGENLSQDGAVYRDTLRLVECSMFAAVAGLAFFLSNSLALEVATGMLLLVLSGPVKALTYLLMHGLLGLTMGTLWRLGTNWGLSIFLCAFVRAFGSVGYVLISSFLIRENILALITINIHTSLTFIITSLGINSIPSMNAIYAIFGTLLLINCGFFVFLLHILYGILFVKLGMKGSLHLPRWLEKAI